MGVGVGATVESGGGGVKRVVVDGSPGDVVGVGPVVGLGEVVGTVTGEVTTTVVGVGTAVEIVGTVGDGDGGPSVVV